MKQIAREIETKRASKVNPSLDQMAAQLSRTYDHIKKYEKKTKEDRKVRMGPKRHSVMSVKTGKRLDIELTDEVCCDFADAIFSEIYSTLEI